MKNYWKQLDKKWQSLLKIASILTILTGGFTISGFIQWGIDIKDAPEDIETLHEEVSILNLEIDALKKNQEMVWQMFRENTNDPDTTDYEVAWEDGSAWDVDIRESHLGNPTAFVFNHTIWPARWSDTNRGYSIIGPDGKEQRIFKK